MAAARLTTLIASRHRHRERLLYGDTLPAVTRQAAEIEELIAIEDILDFGHH